MFDFDMSYVTIAAIVFFCLGSMIGVYNDKELALPIFTLKRVPLKRVYPIFLVLLTIVVGVVTFRSYSAQIQFDKATALAQQQRPIEEIFPQLDKAISLAPADTQFRLVKADWLSQVYSITKNSDYLDQWKTTLQQAQAHDHYDRQIVQAQYNNRLASGNYAEATAVLEEGINKFPWDITLYELAIKQYSADGLKDKQAHKQDYEISWNRARELYKEIVTKTEQLKNLPKEQLQGRRFDISTAVRQEIGLILYHSAQYQEAAELLKPALGEALTPAGENPEAIEAAAASRAAVRYYLASITKLGQSDPELQQSLIQADTNEAKELQALLAN